MLSLVLPVAALQTFPPQFRKTSEDLISVGRLSETLENREKEIIEAALAESRGTIAGPNGAAAKLGIPRSTLDWKIRQLKINRHRFDS